MPVTQEMSQQQQHHHHHNPFSVIGSFLTTFHHHSQNPSSSVIAPSSPSPSSSHGSSNLLSNLYQAFESQLADRLSSLLSPDDSPSVSLASLNQLMRLLLSTQIDLRTFVPTRPTHTKSMEEFLERSFRLLDVCRGVNERIVELQSLQGMLHLVSLCLNSESGNLSRAQVQRARKALAQLVLHMDIEREDHTDHVQTGQHRSFRGKLRERLSGERSQQRWRTWQRHHSASFLSHGSPGAVSSSGRGDNATAPGNNASAIGNVPTHGNHVAVPLGHGVHGAHGVVGAAANSGGNLSLPRLLTVELNLSPPRYPPKGEEECFCAAMYALNALSILSLGTISAALPGISKSHCAGYIHPPDAALWASPFLRLQDKVDDDHRKRSKKHGGYAGMWELDQISLLAKRLLEFVSQDDFATQDDIEEAKKAVKMFSQHVKEVEREVGALQSQINEFYSRIVGARIEVLDLLSAVGGEIA